MNTTIVNFGTKCATAKIQLTDTIVSAHYLQLQLNTKLEKITYEVESMIGEEDIVKDALNKMSKRGYVPVSLDKYDAELTRNEACIKVKLEFTCTKAV